jgi:hypothetical protein
MQDIESGNISTQNPVNTYLPISNTIAVPIDTHHNVLPIPTEQIISQLKKKATYAVVFYCFELIFVLVGMMIKQTNKAPPIGQFWYVFEFLIVLIYLGILLSIKKIVDPFTTIAQQDECMRFINTMKFWVVYCCVYFINFVLWWLAWYGLIIAVTEDFNGAKTSLALMIVVSILQFFYSIYDEKI